MSEQKTELEVWYDFAIQQMVAEAYLDGIDRSDQDQVTERLQLGNNELRPEVYVNGHIETNNRFGVYPDGKDTPILPGATRLTSNQADIFFSSWEIRDQHANDPSGFSATLIQKRGTNEFTLAFRSTEFFDQRDGGDHQRDVSGADTEIFTKGFALPQLSAMERYYSELKSSGLLPAGATLNVTGYSLGGHLATVFTEMHAADVTGTYLFNGSGRGGLANGFVSPAQLVNAYDQILSDPSYAFSAGLLAQPDSATPADLLFQSAQSSASVDWNDHGNIYLSARHQWAEYVLSRYETSGLAESLGAGFLSPAAESKITYIYGVGSNGDSLVVSNGGISAKSFEDKSRVLVEDQPDAYGSLTLTDVSRVLSDGDFARTHSITLIADSLAVINLFRKVDPSLSQDDVETIIAASSNQRASSVTVLQGSAFAEANSLERAVDALAKVLMGPGLQPLPFDGGPDGFGDADNREAFYSRIASVESWLTAHPGLSLAIEVLPAMQWEQTFQLATIRSMHTVPDPTSAEALAGDAASQLGVRYALRELNPFAVVGDDSIYDAESLEDLSDEYLQARAEMAAALFDRNIRDAGYAPQQGGDNVLYESSSAGESSQVVVANTQDGGVAGVLAAAAGLPNGERDATSVQALRNAMSIGHTRSVNFGGDGSQRLTGGPLGDSLFGGEGSDRLEGGAGDDYLEGGQGNDRLEGGSGYDTYVADAGDTIVDKPESPRSGIIYAGAQRLQLSDAFRTEGKPFFENSQGVQYWESDSGQVVAYLPGGGRIVIEAPTGAVPGRETTSGFEVTGRPDLGIRLVTQLDNKPRPDSVGMVQSILEEWRKALTVWTSTDPLALDLDGDGLETLDSAPGDAVLFDHSGDGVRDGSGWLGADDAWLVMDRDGDGRITKGSELFGVDTLLPDGSKASDGYAALAPLDTSGNGVIDEEDEEFADLSLWRDANSDGVSQEDEILTLEEAGVVSIRLDPRPVTTLLPGNNMLVLLGSYEREDGSTRAAGALNLIRETFYREYVAPPESADAGSALPNVGGSGRVRDLGEASAESELLADALLETADAAARSEQAAAASALVQSWADSSAMLTGSQAALERDDKAIVYYRFNDLTAEQPGLAYLLETGGGGVPLSSLPADWYLSRQSEEYQERVRKIGVLERFVGQTYADLRNPNPVREFSDESADVYSIAAPFVSGNWQYLQNAYSALEDAVYLSVAAQTRLAGYIDAFALDPAGRDFSALEAMLDQKRAQDPVAALGDLYDLTRAVGPQLVERGWYALPGLLDRWLRESMADPAQAQALVELGVRVRDSDTLTGGVNADVLLGNDWQGSGVRRTLGGSGNDFILGGEGFQTEIFDGPGSDVIVGSAHADTYQGGAGKDTYLFGRGSGADLLQPEILTRSMTALDRDTLQFLPGVAPSDVIVRHLETSGMLELRIQGTGDSFRDRFFAFNDGAGPGVLDLRSLDKVRFADGTVWSVQDLRLAAGIGTEGDDNGISGNPVLAGFLSSNDFLDGRGGNDELHGLWGDDSLYGGTGNDRLVGDLGDDLLDGGTGDDALNGGLGADTYVFGRGDGRDTIDEIPTDGSVNVLRLRDINPGELSRQDNVLRVAGSDDRITLASPGVIGRILYADGSEGTVDALAAYVEPPPPDNPPPDDPPPDDPPDDSGGGEGPPDDPNLPGPTDGDDFLFGTPGADILAGGKGNDTLLGDAGSDTYVYNLGDGSDIFAEDPGAGGEPNYVQFGPGIAVADLHPEIQFDGLVWSVGIGSGADSILMVAGTIAEFRFANGTTRTMQQLLSPAEPEPPAEEPGEDAPDDPAPPDTSELPDPPDEPGPPVVEQREIPALPPAPLESPSTVTAIAESPVMAAATPAAAADASPAAASPVAPVARAAQAQEAAIDAAPAAIASAPARVPDLAAGAILRDAYQQLDTPQQVGRPSLGERYSQAIREFEERRMQREEPALPPPPTDEEVAAWNQAMHAWHEQNRGFAEMEEGAGGGGWSLGWGIGGGDGRALDGSTQAGTAPGIANPYALPRLSGASAAPGVQEGLRELR